jgi:hypothetical protein
MELTDDIKQYIIDNRIYIIPEKQKKKQDNISEELPLFIIMHGENVDGMKIRQTNETPARVSVYDLIDVVTETIDQSKKIYIRIKEEYSESLFSEVNTIISNNLYKFPGKYQKSTPVVDALGVVNIINLIPGPKAAIFRIKNADIILNHLGADLNLINKIKRNVTNDSLITFLNKENDMILYDKLKNVENIRDLGIPNGTKSPNCVYCIMIGFYEDLNKLVFKFGLCENFTNRITIHRKTFPHSKVIFIISLGEYAVKPVEDTIKNFEKIKNKIVNVSTKNSIGHEHFACIFEDMDEVINDILEEIKFHHSNIIDNIFYKDQTTNFLQTNEKEKTKQAEEITKQKLAEEITKQKLAEEITKQKLAEEITKQKVAEELTKQVQASLRKTEIEFEMMKLKLQYNNS